MSAAWLHVVGVTEAGMSAMTEQTQSAISSAKHVFGSARLLNFVRASAAGDLHEWQSPFGDNIAQLKELRGQPCVILASGDPLWFGVGATLLKHFDASEIALTVAPSSFQLAASEMKWPLQNCATISLHGRPVQNLVQALAPNQNILALTSDASTLVNVAAMLNAQGYDQADLTVLENLGGPEFARTKATIDQAKGATKKIGDFYVLAIQTGPCNPPALPHVPGLPDGAFEHDGQLTKRDVRAVTLAKLAPLPSQLLWDVGAGCGSVSIEWMRAARGSKAVAIERDIARVQMIKRNAIQLGVPSLQTVQDDAHSALKSLSRNQQPDAIFIGGSADDGALFQLCWAALASQGRLVVNAVTIGAQAELFKRQAEMGGELTQISISTLENLGTQNVMRPKLPIVQWNITKGSGA